MANSTDVITYVTDRVFKTTWNNIRAEHRVNILMTKTSKTYITGSMPVGAEYLNMPTDGPFVVLQTNRQYTDCITTPADMWISSSDLINHYGAYLHLYGLSGKMMPKDEVYLYTSKGGSKSFIAIRYSAINVCQYSISDNFYATIYLDSDQPNQVTCKSFVIPSTNASSTILQVRSYIHSCVSTNMAGTHIYYNGELIPSSVFMTMTPSSQSRIDIILDTNVVGEFVVDARGGFGYSSNKYRDYRYLLHCPKLLNPNNAVITHNTVEIFVQNKETKCARYFHRTDTNAVTQITHNDIAINTTVLEAFVDSMGTADIELVIKIRRHSNENVLLDDMHFIKTMYLLDDETIIKCLLGQEDSSLPFWTAQSLESSGYIDLMFDVPNVYTETTLDALVDALGLPQIISMTSESIAHIPRNATNKTVTMAVPVSLWDVVVYPVVYVNGVYVSSDMYSYSRPTSTKIVISFDTAFYLPTDAVISLRLLENIAGDYTPVVWTPSVNNNSITITGKECHVYKVVEVAESQLPSGGSTTVGYVPLTTSGGTLSIVKSDTSYKVTVGSSLFGSTIIIYRGNAVVRQELTTHIDNAISACAPMCYSLSIEASDGRMVPAFNHFVDIYLNRSYLVKDIGYTLTDIKIGTAILSRELAIVDRRYLLESENSLVVIYHTERALISDTYYAVDGKLSYNTSVSPWVTTMSGVHAHGLLTTASNIGQWLTINDTSNVTEYDMRLSVPYGLSEMLSGYSITDYSNRLAIINAYLNTALPVANDRIIITDSYQIYSPYTCAVVAAVVSGKLEIANDPSVTRFKSQFEPYEHYKLVDIAFTKPPTHDLQFIDVLPTTGNAELTIAQYAALRRFINMALSDDEQTEGNMING